MTAILALVLSGLAVAISASTLAFNVRSRRRELFLSIHERLIADEIRNGRRLLAKADINSMQDAQAFRDRAPADFEQICQSLAMLDVLGCYSRRRFVSRNLVLEEWGHTCAGQWAKGRHVISLRLEQEKGTWSAWPNFQRLGVKATKWAKTHPPRSLPDL